MIPWWHWPLGIVGFYLGTGILWWLIGMYKMYKCNGWENVFGWLPKFLKLGPLAFVWLIFFLVEDE